MSGPRTNAAFYAAPVSEFLAANDEQAYAPLAAPKGYTLAPEQLSAWHLQLPVLLAALASQKGASHHFRDVDGDGEADGENGGRHLFASATAAPWIHLEFDIPRLGRRVDAVLVTPTCVIPIEFKVGAKKFERLDIEQAWDFRLDIKNFHAPSHAAAIFPLLCATDAPKSDRRWRPPHADGVCPPFCCNAAGLGTAIALALAPAVGPGSPGPTRESTITSRASAWPRFRPTCRVPPPRAARPRLFLARAAARELRGGAADTLRCRRIFRATADEPPAPQRRSGRPAPQGWFYRPWSLLMSSVGVQMTGTCFPKLRNQRSIGRRMSSFARCVQFQVNKKSIRYTDAYATWNASRPAESIPFGQTHSR